MDELRELASEMPASSWEIKATLAPRTAQAFGDKVRITNSHDSNSIEGIVSSYVEIEAGLLRKNCTSIFAERYKQENGPTYIQVEKGGGACGTRLHNQMPT